MASQNSDSSSGPPDRITFDVERLGVDDPGQVVISGRWSGVRGRRFMRPALVVQRRSDGSEQRSLAELEHKPWAAEDGELWTAAFPLDIELGDAASIELSVAPDIAVELAPPKGPRAARSKPRAAAAPDARAPRVRSDPTSVRRTASEHFQQLDRLKAKLSAAEDEAEREHARRQSTEAARDKARVENLALRSEVGRLAAKLDLAATAQGELASTAAEVDGLRTGAQNAERRLEAAARALEHERAETARLRQQLAAAEATVERLTRSDDATVAEPSRPEPVRPELVRAEPGRHQGSRHEPGRPEGTRHEPSRHEPNPRTERPLNPALRGRTNWVGRALALLVILVVIAAVILVIHSTIA
jgi:hypothetical protein